MLARLALCCCL